MDRVTATEAPADGILPFAGASGRGLKIAVIDSGVNIRHPHITAPTQGVTLVPEETGSWEDTLGHGTAVIAAIQEKAPEAEYYAVKVFGTALRTTSARLMQAIEWALTNGIDIVNLSLGTPNLNFSADMRALVGQADKVGTILVAASTAGEAAVLPGSLDGVIGVDVDWSLPRHGYRIEGAHYYASGYPRTLPGVPPAWNLNGISFAVANMSGLAARACGRLKIISFEGVSNALRDEAQLLGRGPAI